MNEDLKDILANLNKDVDQETLLRYLQGKLSAADQHEVEKKLMDDAFETEALEGLQTFNDKKSLASLVENLNADLKKNTAKNKNRRLLNQVNLPNWLLLAIIIILVIAVIGFIIIRRLKSA